jgi:anti-sigma factor RsiW
MNCKLMETSLIPYMDGLLPDREHEEVDGHLRVCPDCSDRVRGFHRVSDLLETWQDIEPSASFDARLENRILASTTGASGWWQRIVSAILVPISRPVLAGAMMAVMLVAVVLVRYSPRTSGEALATEQPSVVVANLSDGDDITLYKDLPVLENWEMLSDFDVLQELKTSTP